MADAEGRALDLAPTRLLIDGEWREASDRSTLAVEDPSTGEPLAEVADATPEDGKAALDAASGAQPRWAATSPGERAQILHRAYEALNEQAEPLALLMTLEMGKPLAESRAEVLYAGEFFRWFAGEALRLEGDFKTAGNGQGRVLVMRQPIGPCYLITPWNFPMAMGARKIGPALAAGCSMVVKPAQQTPLSMLALAKVLVGCGVPDGVVNVVTSSSSAEISAPIIADRRLRKLSFTGSTEVGRRLTAQAAENVLKVSMELGGNAPFLVFADADLDAAVDGAMVAKMRNVGQACTAANRFHVSASAVDEFTAKLAERMDSLTVGRGTEAGVDVGPLISAYHRDKVADLVDDARRRGADCPVGGARRDGPGYYFEPTVLSGVPPGARVLDEEIFGPVAPITAFADEAEAVAAANATEYGLAAYVFTGDLSRALRVSEALETGMIGLNQGLVSNPGAPFGGMKQSGIGREGGSEGIQEYLETKYVAVSA